MGNHQRLLHRQPPKDIADAKNSHVLQVVKYDKRKALVKPNEFARLMADIKQNQQSMQPSTYHCLMLLAYTGVRIGDIRTMKWADVDMVVGKWELIPLKGRSNSGIKMIEKMDVPLSRQVLDILKAQERCTGAYSQVFHSAQGVKGVLSENTTNKALEHLGYKNRHTSHGFRSSAKSLLMQGLDYNDLVTEMMLGHVVHGGGNPYLRADLYEKRAEMMQRWADYIDDLADGKDTSHHKGIYRQPPHEIISVLVDMLGLAGVKELLKDF